MSALGLRPDRFVGVFDAGVLPARPLPGRRRRTRRHRRSGVPVRPQHRADRRRRARPDRGPVRPDQRRAGAGLDASRSRRSSSCRRATPATRPCATAAPASFQDWRTTLRAYGSVFEMDDAAEAYIAETEAAHRRPAGRPRRPHRPLDVHRDEVDAGRVHDQHVEQRPRLGRARDDPALGAGLPDAAAAGRGRRSTSTARSSCRPRTSTSSTATGCSSRCGRARRQTRTARCGPHSRVVQDGGIVEDGNHFEYGGTVWARGSCKPRASRRRLRATLGCPA